MVAVFLLLLVVMVLLIYFRQHAIIYHPRPYDASYTAALPANSVQIAYTMPFGKQTAYYLPGKQEVPARVWVAFCGNGSLALDWTSILRGFPQNGDGLLLVDYPGYGKNAGYATIESTRASADAALKAVRERLHLTSDRLVICTIGHSLGAAVALDFATRHDVERVVLIAPFTTLREEAATVVGQQLARLLIENYDNRKNLAAITRQNPAPAIAVFHGKEDQVIPFRMGAELARSFPSIAFFDVEGADHVSVLTIARSQIIAFMTGGAGRAETTSPHFNESIDVVASLERSKLRSTADETAGPLRCR